MPFSLIIASMINDKMKDSKMNTKVDIILAECESIISDVENVYQFLTDGDINTFDLEQLEIDTIRCTTEELISLVLDFDKKNTNALREQIVDQSISLYQDCKYIIEAFEDEYSFLMTDEIAKSFSYIRASVDTIRDAVNIL